MVASTESKANVEIVRNPNTNKEHLKIDKQITVVRGQSATWRIADGLEVTWAKVWFPDPQVTKGDNPKEFPITPSSRDLDVLVDAKCDPGTYPYVICCDCQGENFEQGGHQMADGPHSHPDMIVKAL
jgi:hypothetical protein